MFSISHMLKTSATVLVSLSILFSGEQPSGGMAMVDARSSRADRIDYPEIAKAFEDRRWGKNYYWKSYDCTTKDNYELTMFRLLGKTRRRKVKK